jgi:hypothetical protein
MKSSHRLLLRNVSAALIAISFSACDPDDTTDGILITDPIDCLPSSLQNGLLAFYPMSSGSLEDATDMEYHLSNPTTASTTADRGGNPQCAYYFNAQNNEYLKYDNPDFLDGLNAITISLWFQPDSASGGHLQALVCRGDGGGHCPNTVAEWSLGIFDCHQPVFGYQNNDLWFISSQIPPAYNAMGCAGVVQYYSSQWHHLLAIYENGNYQIWMDGMPTEDPFSQSVCPNPEIMEDQGALYIGRTYSGKIDDVAIYNRALTPAEIQQMWTLAPCCD